MRVSSNNYSNEIWSELHQDLLSVGFHCRDKAVEVQWMRRSREQLCATNFSPSCYIHRPTEVKYSNNCTLMMHSCVGELLLVFISLFREIVRTPHCLCVCNFPCIERSILEQTFVNMFIVVLTYHTHDCYFWTVCLMMLERQSPQKFAYYCWW